MMAIKTTEVREMIREANDGPIGTQFPVGLSSEHVLVPELNFLKNEWTAYWDGYKRANNFAALVKRLGKNAKICDVFAAAARVEMAIITADAAADLGIDAAPALFVANVRIGPAPLNGISEGGHATGLVVFTRDNNKPELAFWEPQQPIGEKFTYVPIREAVSSGVDLLDVFI